MATFHVHVALEQVAAVVDLDARRGGIGQRVEVGVHRADVPREVRLARKGASTVVGSPGFTAPIVEPVEARHHQDLPRIGDGEDVLRRVHHLAHL